MEGSHWRCKKVVDMKKQICIAIFTYSSSTKTKTCVTSPLNIGKQELRMQR